MERSVSQVRKKCDFSRVRQRVPQAKEEQGLSHTIAIELFFHKSIVQHEHPKILDSSNKSKSYKQTIKTPSFPLNRSSRKQHLGVLSLHLRSDFASANAYSLRAGNKY